MPELPEVETVRRGLAPVMEGFVFDRVQLNRPDLRFPFAKGFIDRIQETTLTRLTRRAKFLQAELSSGERLFMHLGMSGRFTIDTSPTADFVHAHNTNPKHDHVIFEMSSGARITYNDPRRFGFMELIGEEEPSALITSALSLWAMALMPLTCARNSKAKKAKSKPPCSISVILQGLAIYMSAKRFTAQAFHPNALQAA